MRQRWFRKILRRRVFVILLLVIQGLILIRLIADTSSLWHWMGIGLSLVSFFAALHIINSKEKASYKLLWVFHILIFPVFGGLLYLLIRLQKAPRMVGRELEKQICRSQAYLLDQTGSYERACQKAPDCIPQIYYLQNNGFPVYDNTSCSFFPSGESAFSSILEELEQASRYIFLEYFIIHEGKMWGAIHEILKRKASQGILVRVLYDDIGSFLTLPQDYAAQLRSEGIQCQVFNPFRPVLSAIQNNRDHRKIISIDGKVAFTGGFNLADEYINEIERFGHWKDAGLILKGEAAWSMTVMFLQMWNLSSGVQDDYAGFMPPAFSAPSGKTGLVQPYADSPVGDVHIGEHVYLQIIHQAKHYIYIYTPYLIVDETFTSALTLAAQSGVDVRIVTPYHWDKRLVHMTTQAAYGELLEAGVRIYEYTPGFLHAKMLVSDDLTAAVGTVNLDYRSLYLHFECGVWFHGNDAVCQCREDFLNTLEVSQEIMPGDCRRPLPVRVFRALLKLWSPLF